MGGYMALTSKKLKFVDITNYLAAGISLAKFYTSYGVTTMKGFFPYSLVKFPYSLVKFPYSLVKFPYSLVKLSDTDLPDIEEFRSILTKETISPEGHQLCKDVWRRDGMETFGDFVSVKGVMMISSRVYNELSQITALYPSLICTKRLQ